MIRIVVRREQGRITGFFVDGHAEFAEPGFDVVCAGVSAVTQGTVNAIEALTGVVSQVEAESGRLHMRLPDHQAERDGQVQLLLESMVIMLRSIQQTYGRYVRMEDREKK